MDDDDEEMDNLKIIDDGGHGDYGEYDAGEEPEDSDSQLQNEDFEVEEEEGEEESDGDKQPATTLKVMDSSSKVSTAYTNEDMPKMLNMLGEGKASIKKKNGFKIKKAIKAPKVKDENGE